MISAFFVAEILRYFEHQVCVVLKMNEQLRDYMKSSIEFTRAFHDVVKQLESILRHPNVICIMLVGGLEGYPLHF